MVDNGLLTPTEAARFLGVHKNTLDRIVRSGKLEAVRIGIGRKAHRRFRRQDLEELLKPQSERAS